MRPLTASSHSVGSVPGDNSGYDDGVPGPNAGGVSWLLLTTPGRVSSADLAAFRRLFPDGDAREPQPLNGRRVRLREQRG